MLKSVRLGRRRTIKLPPGIFQPTDRVAVLTEGNTVIVKKLAPSRLSDFSSRVKGTPMPLKEVVKEVQRYRKEKRK